MNVPSLRCLPEEILVKIFAAGPSTQHELLVCRNWAEILNKPSVMRSLLNILASSGASLTSLRLATDNIQPINAASQVSLEGVWPDIFRAYKLVAATRSYFTTWRLDYITFDGFDHFKFWSRSAPVAVPLRLSRLADLRSLTLRCCGFQSLSEELSNLRSLEHLDMMDPYQDLQVLQQMSPLTWCNQKRHAKGGSVYLRRPDPDLLEACFHADMPLHTVNIKSRCCFARFGLPDGFVQLRHLQEVFLQEAGMNWLPGGPWLQQLKILDLSHNYCGRIPQ
ncbi:hypothetical protein WJX79_004116 [Trebouxia sp. C0005]